MRLNEIYQTYKDRVDLYCVYVREAHPEDSLGGYRTSRNVDEGIVINQQTTIDERAEAAEVCMLHMNLDMPMLLDDMDDSIENAYVAWPDRLYTIDAEGNVTYRSEMGPQGFHPDDWEAAIKELLGVRAAA